MVEFRTEQIKALREDRGLTMEEAAAKVGWTRQRWHIVESGINVPTAKTLVKLCNAFNVSPSFFFTEPPTHIEGGKAA